MLSLGLCAMACLLPGADARVWPGEVALHGHGATQRLIVGDAVGPTLTADRTAQAKFSTTDPKIATVNEEGIVHAAGDGTATIHV
ncbi:MAG: hypothetical protein K1X57_19605, partial [Gemmataceae bacterium]|nr:hypothetical protein [Gemmataceae bacterium]